MRRRIVCALMITLCLFLTACGGGKSGRAEELAINIRGEYLAMTACTAKLAMTADYGERVYDYGLDLAWGKESGYTLAVTAPADLAGVSIRIEAGQTALEYDGARIETGPVTPGGLSPIDAIPAFLGYAKEGFMSECAEEELDGVKALRVRYREPDSTPGTGVEADLWFDLNSHALRAAELSSDGIMVLRCIFHEFSIKN